jgi:hypothetical protein
MSDWSKCDWETFSREHLAKGICNYSGLELRKCVKLFVIALNL